MSAGNDKYIMILGAGLMQRPSIEAARELGYKTLVVDANPDAVCVPFADRFEKVDLKDRQGLLQLALSLKDSIAAVFTAGTDFSASVSYVAEKLGLPSHSFQAALNASDKTLMRGCFEEAGVPSPSFTKIQRSQIASYVKDGLESIHYPKVVKPVDNMGARGCRLIRERGEFLQAVEEAVSFSRSGTAILEDYMRGPEFSIDAIVFDGTLTITGFADRHIFYEPYFIEMGHTMPSVFPEEKRKELIAAFARGIASLGLTCGVAKADIKYTDNGPMIGEIAARLSGGYMSGWTFPYASGVNLTKQAMLVALGKEPSELLARRVPVDLGSCGEGVRFKVFDLPCVKVSAERAWISIPGIVSEVINLDRAETEPFVKNVLPRLSCGAAVDFPRNNVEKCGNVISLAATHDLAVQASERAVSNIVLRLEKNSPATESFLARDEKFAEKNFPPDAFVLTEPQRIKLEQYFGALGTIPKNTGCAKIDNSEISEFAENITDYNHRTLLQTLVMFDRICPEHPALNASKFCKVLIRGGLQGLLYTLDSSGF